MANLPHILMTSDEERDPSPYTTSCTMKEQLVSLPLHQKGTRKDTYDQEGNLVFNVTTVDDNGNTISDGDQTDNDSKSIVSNDDHIIHGNVTYNYNTQVLTYDNGSTLEDVAEDNSTPCSKSWRRQHHKQYKVPSPRPNVPVQININIVNQKFILIHIIQQIQMMIQLQAFKIHPMMIALRVYITAMGSMLLSIDQC